MYDYIATVFILEYLQLNGFRYFFLATALYDANCYFIRFRPLYILIFIRICSPLKFAFFCFRALETAKQISGEESKLSRFERRRQSEEKKKQIKFCKITIDALKKIEHLINVSMLIGLSFLPQFLPMLSTSALSCRNSKEGLLLRVRARVFVVYLLWAN